MLRYEIEKEKFNKKIIQNKKKIAIKKLRTRFNIKIKSN
jgi:hypothetical protein